MVVYIEKQLAYIITNNINQYYLHQHLSMFSFYLFAYKIKQNQFITIKKTVH